MFVKIIMHKDNPWNEKIRTVLLWVDLLFKKSTDGG